MYEKYYTQRLHEVHNGEVVNDVYVEEFETPDKHVVKGMKNNNPFLFVLRNSHVPIATEAVEKLLAQEKLHDDAKSIKKTKSANKTKSIKKTKSANKTKSLKKEKSKNITQRSKQSSKANKTKSKK